MKLHGAGFSWFKAAAAALAVSATAWFMWEAFREARDIPREVVFSVEWDEVALLCSRQGADVRSVMESLAAIGVSALVVKDQVLDDFASRGQAVKFSHQEAAKLKGLGLVEESSPVDSGTVWIRDRQLASDLEQTASGNGLEFSSRTLQGFTVFSFGRDLQSLGFPLGPDPQAVAEADYSGMAVVFDAARCSGFSRPVERVLSDPSVLAAGILVDSEQRCRSAAPEAARFERWLISPSASAAARRLRSRNVPVLPSGRAAYRNRYAPAYALDAVREDSVRFLRVGFNTEKSVDENLGALRAMTKNIRDNGYETAFPAFSVSGTFRGFGNAGRLLALVIAALAPLFAVKISLEIIKAAAHYRHSMGESRVFLNAASPAWEIAAGAASVIIIVLLCGLWVHALAPLGFPGGHRTGTFIAGCVPVILALFILYGEILAGLSRWYGSSLTVRDFITVSAGILFVALFVSPVPVIEHSRRLLSFIWRLADSFPILRRHWREILLAYPSLIMAFWLYLSKFVSDHEPDSRHCHGRIFGGDFRPFMMLGILVPVLAFSNFARPESPFIVTAWRTVLSAFWGCLFGGALVAGTSTFIHIFGDYPQVPESKKPLS